MPDYSNGYIPTDLLVTFERGYNDTDGHWNHSLSAATYSRHLALVARAQARTGRTLTISDGWGAYRPYAAQVIARNVYGNGAAWPGTSSHGGFWEGQQTLAMDYSNWSWVYDGDREAFFADCRSVGLSPGYISAARGYVDEWWHVIDLDPWSATPAFDGSTAFNLGGFLMALSDAQQAQIYDALIEHGPTGDYYKTDAILGDVRKFGDGLVARTDASNTRLDAVLAILGSPQSSVTLTDAQITELAKSLREGLGNAVADELAARLSG